MQIAQEVVGINNPLPQSNWSDNQAQVKELQLIDSTVKNIPIVTKDELKTNYLESSNSLQEQAIVTDSTGASKALVESVKSDLNKGKKLYSQNVDEILDNQLSSDERARTLDLEVTSFKIKDGSNELKAQFDQPSDSTIIRAAGQIADNIGLSTNAIKKRNITLPSSNKKDNGN